jgi:pimeloyl-ACP methyl ester carboxylesterase
MPELIIDDIELYYETRGSGAPLMLIAGLASDSGSWSPIIEGLSRECLVITPDNRGCGRTLPQETETGIRRIADDCAALVGSLGLTSVNLLGHSMGGLVAMDLAIRYPQTVDKLILCCTAASNSGRNISLFSTWASAFEAGLEPRLFFKNIFYWLFTPRFFEDEAAVDEAAMMAAEYPYPQSAEAFSNQVRAIAGFDCRGGLAAIKAKTLVICGREDLLYTPEEGKGLAGAIPGASLAIIDKAAHSIHIEQPAAFIERVLGFLR